MAWVESGTSAGSSGSATSATATLPSGYSTGELLLLVASAVGGAITAPPSPWNSLGDRVNSIYHGYLLCWAIADGTEANVSLAWGGFIRDYSWAMAALKNDSISGTITLDNAPSPNENGADSTPPAPSITVANADSVVVRMVGTDDLSGSGVTPVSGYTEIHDTAGSNRPQTEICFLERGAGTEAAGNFTIPASARSATCSIAFYIQTATGQPSWKRMAGVPHALGRGGFARGGAMWARRQSGLMAPARGLWLPERRAA